MCMHVVLVWCARTMEYVVHLGGMPKVMVCMEVGLILVQSPPRVLKLLWILRKERDQKEEEDVQD